jgi:hypothetical protein
MTRAQRLFHRLVWPALIVMVTLGLSFALALRPPVVGPPDAQTQTQTPTP